MQVFVALLFWSFVLCITLQCGYALYFFTRIFTIPTQLVTTKSAADPVSVIICAKNEARCLEQNLPAILAQRYTNEAGKTMYEVIVVNDASTDDTATVLQAMEQRYDNLWTVHLEATAARPFKGKKYALAQGVKYAANATLLFTDADCIPADEYWLQNMVAPMRAGKEIVVGYGCYANTAGLLNAFTRWETMHSFLQGATYTLAGLPYMAVGRNMACTKDIFIQAAASETWNAVPSGDDDLLMAIAATAGNTAVVYNSHSYTTTIAKTSWQEWLLQKQRHMSTGKYYKGRIKTLLGIYAISHAFIWLFFFVLIAMGNWKVSLLLMSLRCLLYWAIMAITSRKLKEALLFSLPFFDLGWMLYNFVLSPYIIFKNKTRWT